MPTDTESEINSVVCSNADDLENTITIKPGGDFKTRFDVQEELGKGRFGVVHKVIEHETGQMLAAKTVKCIKGADKLKVTINLCYVAFE